MRAAWESLSQQKAWDPGIGHRRAGLRGVVVTEEGCRLFKNRSSVVPGLGWGLAGSQVRLVAWRVGVGRGLNSAWAWGVDSAPAPSPALLYFRRQHRKWAFTMSGYRKLSDY